MKKNFWRGVEGVELLWHGEWSDPELRYGNIVANCTYVEEYLETCWMDDVDNDMEHPYWDKFSEWCQDHREDVIGEIYLNQCYDSKRYNFFDALDGGEIEFEDAIVVDGLYVKSVFMDEDCRMWVRDIDDVEYEIRQVSEYDKYRREFVRYYGGHDAEMCLIEAYAEQCYGEWKSK